MVQLSRGDFCVNAHYFIGTGRTSLLAAKRQVPIDHLVTSFCCDYLCLIFLVVLGLSVFLRASRIYRIPVFVFVPFIGFASGNQKFRTEVFFVRTYHVIYGNSFVPKTHRNL